MSEEEQKYFKGLIGFTFDSDDIRYIEKIVDKKDKEIERLNNIIEEYKNANEYHQNIIHELETMKQPNQLHSENIKLRAKNNRLNNIINELEKDLGLELMKTREPNEYNKGLHNAFGYIKNKLQELKGE